MLEVQSSLEILAFPSHITVPHSRVLYDDTGLIATIEDSTIYNVGFVWQYYCFLNCRFLNEFWIDYSKDKENYLKLMYLIYI